MLMYLIRAIPISLELTNAAEKAAKNEKTMMAQSRAIRKIVPWSEIVKGLWENGLLKANDFINPLDRLKTNLKELLGFSKNRDKNEWL